MGGTDSNKDFDWVYTQEPHATRRKEMLAKYPQIKKLMGHDPSLKYIVFVMVMFQFFMAYMLQEASWPIIIVLAYLLGGSINHSLTLANHEISHNLAFGHTRPLANRFLGMFVCLPIGFPMSIGFKKYHLDHHRYQGDDEKDVDIPTTLEAKFFKNSLTKFIWVFNQPWFYIFRPLFIQPKPMGLLEAFSILVGVSFDIAVYHFWGFKALFYFIGGSILGSGLHPLAGHFISEHYVFKKGFETYSYYGPLNLFVFNVGYHNEHHDFPSIPGWKLPEVRKIAPEYYDNLPYHTSWVKVIYDFIMDPKIDLYSRVKRKSSFRTKEAIESEDKRTQGIKDN
ncbi:hypothetical protein ScPMuIL_014801 [Solemya velum]